MMEAELFQSSWPFYGAINSSLDEFMGLDMDDNIVDDCEFSPSFTTQDDISDISSDPHFSSMFLSENVHDLDIKFPEAVEDYLVPEEQMFYSNFCNEMEMEMEMENIYGGLSDSEGNLPSQEPSSCNFEEENAWSPSFSEKSHEVWMSTPSLILPQEGVMELSNRLKLLHLLKACGESIEGQQRELADVILNCISEKVSPGGEALERVAFNLSQVHEKQGDYLKQESLKNFDAAFRAFYQIFPYGKFAHFAANSAILEAMPDDAEVIHVVDFDIGEGIQWPPLIEALAQQHKAMKLTTIKWETEDCDDQAPLLWSFEEVKRRLVDHARSYGMKLKVEEMGIEDLVDEIKRRKKRGGSKEWLAFNCNVGLPHMRRVRSRMLVAEFMSAAMELMASSKGVITLGDGDAWEDLKDRSGFGSFFDGNVVHYQALFESIESSFPTELAQARMALECLFVAPHISCDAWLHKWIEMKEGCDHHVGKRLEGCRVSRESLEEAREMVNGSQDFYKVRIGGQGENEMILEWQGTPLVRVSTWRN